MPRSPLRFAEFELDCERRELRRDARRVDLERMPLELLILLVENEGVVVERAEIVERLWGQETFVDAMHGINTAIKKIRMALKDDADEPRFIQTIKGKGYRFIGPIESAASSDDREIVPPEAPTAAAPDRPPDRAAPIKRWFTGRRIAIVTISLLAAAAIGVNGVNALRWWNSQSHAYAKGPIQSIAVLPLMNLSNRADEEYFADGLTDELITNLAQIRPLRVISHTSVMQYKGARKSLPQIARALNVDAIVEGSVLHADGRVRITAQLLDARNDRHLWARSYARSESDIVAMQDEVARDIGQEIAATLNLSDVKLPTLRRPDNPEAYDNYLRGRYFWNRRTLNDLNRAIGYFQQAIKADPSYAEAYAALGDAYVLLSSYGGPGPSQPLVEARAAAGKALELNGSLSEAYTVLAAVKGDYDLDWPGAEANYRRAIELNPGYPTAHHWYALHLARMRRFEEAETEMRRALELDPLSLIINSDAADVSYCARKPEKALARLRKSLEMDPEFATAHLVLGKVYAEKKEFAQAVSELQTASRLFHGSPNVEALRAYALALAGRRAEARNIAADLERLSQRRYISGADLAIVQCGLGEPENAMRWLNRGFEIRDKGMNILASDPVFDGCRADPQFQDLLRRLNLPQTAAGSLAGGAPATTRR